MVEVTTEKHTMYSETRKSWDLCTLHSLVAGLCFI